LNCRGRGCGCGVTTLGRTGGVDFSGFAEATIGPGMGGGVGAATGGKGDLVGRGAISLGLVIAGDPSIILSIGVVRLSDGGEETLSRESNDVLDLLLSLALACSSRRSRRSSHFPSLISSISSFRRLYFSSNSRIW